MKNTSCAEGTPDQDPVAPAISSGKESDTLIRQFQRGPLTRRSVRIIAFVILVTLIATLATSIGRALRQASIVSQFREQGLKISYDADISSSDYPFVDRRRNAGSGTFGGDLWPYPTAVLAPLPPNNIGGLISDADLEGLEDLRSLQVLDLAYCKISNRTMKRIGCLRRLTRLNLSGTEITDAGLAEIKGLSELRALDVAFTEISDSGLVTMTELDSLEELNLMDTKITDAGLQQLSKLKCLRVLFLDYCPVTADGIAQLEALDRLETLSLDGVSLSDEDVDRLGKLKSLRFLSVLRTEISEERGAKRLRQLIPKLETIHAAGPSFGGGGGEGGCDATMSGGWMIEPRN